MLGMRAPWRLRLQVQAQPPVLPCDSPRSDRRTGVVSCGLRELGGGSGGVEYEEQGWLRLEDGMYLCFVFHDQAEWPDGPDLGILALVLSGR